MPNFSIIRQIDKELSEFYSTKVRLAAAKKEDDSVRFLRNAPKGYFYNQAETVTLIDLYYNSKFEDGEKDKLNQRKIFLNVGKFRSDVASKQIDIDTKDFKFLPDDYADPFTAFFLHKEFKEWAKESYFAELINDCVDALPKYGTTVVKEVGKQVLFTPLQNLRNEQTAKDLQTASFVTEEHPAMYSWEINAMKGWNADGLALKYDECLNVHERYGYVPLGFVLQVNNLTHAKDDWKQYVDSQVIAAKLPKSTQNQKGEHVFFAEQITKRPYREAHWTKQHGRWMGIGVMEDLFENQVARNIIVNLQRRSLHWSTKRLFQSQNGDNVGKNLATAVKDGDVLEVGAQGEIKQIDLTNKGSVEMSQFMQDFEKNADQKSFTYDVATGSMASRTPYRLAVILANAVASFYELKKEKLGLFFKDVAVDFLVPQFLGDLKKKDRVVSMFAGDAGFAMLKDAAMSYVKTEAVRLSLLSGKTVDPQTISDAIDPFQAVQALFFKLSKKDIEEAKFKFDLVITAEELDVNEKIKTLTMLYQAMVAKGDPRADKVLARIMGLSGESLSSFGEEPAPAPVTPAADANTPALPAAAAAQAHAA